MGGNDVFQMSFVLLPTQFPTFIDAAFTAAGQARIQRKPLGVGQQDAVVVWGDEVLVAAPVLVRQLLDQRIGKTRVATLTAADRFQTMERLAGLQAALRVHVMIEFLFEQRPSIVSKVDRHPDH